MAHNILLFVLDQHSAVIFANDVAVVQPLTVCYLFSV